MLSGWGGQLMKVGLNTMPVIPFKVSDGFFQVAENTALSLYNTAAQHYLNLSVSASGLGG
jgi:hypothetical protein